METAIQSTKAKYKNGVLELFDRLSLQEGVEVVVHLEFPEMNLVQRLPKSAKHFLKNLSQLKFRSTAKNGSANHDVYLYHNPHRS